jgi:hypothetical protein
MHNGNEGLHCRREFLFFDWRDLHKEIRSDGNGGLVWLWVCPSCGDVLRGESFAFPGDLEPSV